MDDAVLASGCFINNFDICGGASNKAQQCKGVNFSRFVVRIGDVAVALLSDFDDVKLFFE